MSNTLIIEIAMYSIEELTTQQLLSACVHFVFVIIVPVLAQVGNWTILISLINLLLISLIYISYECLFLISVIEILVGIWAFSTPDPETEEIDIEN